MEAPRTGRSHRGRMNWKLEAIQGFQMESPKALSQGQSGPAHCFIKHMPMTGVRTEYSDERSSQEPCGCLVGVNRS